MTRTALLVVVVSSLLYAGCNDEVTLPPPIRPVLTQTIVPVTTEMFGPFASTVEARYQTQLGFQLAGRMVARDVYVGDAVRKGQRLAALDPTVTQFALNRAIADVTDAKAQLTNAEGIQARQRTLAGGGNATQAALDNAVASRDTAKARLDQTEAALRRAQDQIGYTELHANFDGVITTWTAEVGQYVSNGQAVVTVARPDIREAVVDIPDDLIGEIKSGMAFTVRMQAASIETQGIVREIGPSADAATRSHRVRLTLEGSNPAFRLGTTISVAIARPVAPRIWVPAQAIVDANGAHFVWVLAPDGTHVTRRDVVVTPVDETRVLVTSGLAAGDRVVIAGVHNLADGQRVAGQEGAHEAPTKIERTRF
jgi:RND family efflux transporter MFP subunit